MPGDVTELCGQLMEVTAAMVVEVDVLADGAAPHLEGVAASARRSLVEVVALARVLRDAAAASARSHPGLEHGVAGR
jgi:hypothetical protein